MSETGWRGDLRRARTALAMAMEHAVDLQPRLLELKVAPAGAARLARVLMAQARRAGWLVERGEARSRPVSELHRRSVVLFVSTSTVQRRSVERLQALAGGSRRSCLVVRIVPRAGLGVIPPATGATSSLARERAVAYGGTRLSRATAAVPGLPSSGERASAVGDERAARWALLVAEVTRLRRHEIDWCRLVLAKVLACRNRPFEARALLGRVAAWTSRSSRLAAAVRSDIDRDDRQRAGARLARGLAVVLSEQETARMVDDFVGVLQLCQDVDDDRVALARVGVFLKERLQAAAVAFVAADRGQLRVVTRAGGDPGRLDAARRAIDTGLPVGAAVTGGPTAAAAPVRHGTHVIGSIWCEWMPGLPVAAREASTLLGVAAVATASSLRAVIDADRPPSSSAVAELIGESEAMRRVSAAAVRAAASPFPVLIEGESGSGKELVARAIHAHGPRRDRRFSAINCAALVDELVEAELFGHAKGAFTGAAVERAGLFEEASGGTLFLDEVAELGPRIQAKLLRTLQEGEVRRIGESTVRKVDVRIVAATNRPLAGEVAAGRFRRDLWYRLDVVRIAIPPLRERLEDLPLLVAHLWRTLSQRVGSRAVLSSSAVAALAAYDWPGNVRELQNVLASALVAAPRRGVIGPSSWPGHVTRVAALSPAPTLDGARRQFEERYVRAALARAGGRPSVAARELGITRQGLAKLLVRLGIATDSGPRASSVGM